MESDQASNPPREEVPTPSSDRLPPESFDDAVQSFVESEREAYETVPGLSATRLFELLTHPGRRYVLTYLLRS
ncbi:MAG: hypothetical protein ACQETI_14255, partial [Halobacteriota archaeon]